MSVRSLIPIRGPMRLGALLIVIGILIPVARQLALAAPDWTPLEEPLPLEPTRLAPSRFTTRHDGVYEIVIKIARPPIGSARTTAECLMGWDWGSEQVGLKEFRPPCRAKSVIDLAWHLTPLSGQSVVNTIGERSDQGRVSGIADSGDFSNNEADRTITAFTAKRGWQYRLELQTFADAHSLAFARPRIVVQTTGATNEDLVVETLAYWAAAIILIGVGIAMVLASRRHGKA